MAATRPCTLIINNITCNRSVTGSDLFCPDCLRDFKIRAKFLTVAETDRAVVSASATAVAFTALHPLTHPCGWMRCKNEAKLTDLFCRECQLKQYDISTYQESHLVYQVIVAATGQHRHDTEETWKVSSQLNHLLRDALAAEPTRTASDLPFLSGSAQAAKEDAAAAETFHVNTATKNATAAWRQEMLKQGKLKSSAPTPTPTPATPTPTPTSTGPTLEERRQQVLKKVLALASGAAISNTQSVGDFVQSQTDLVAALDEAGLTAVEPLLAKCGEIDAYLRKGAVVVDLDTKQAPAAPTPTPTPAPLTIEQRRKKVVQQILQCNPRKAEIEGPLFEQKQRDEVLCLSDARLTRLEECIAEMASHGCVYMRNGDIVVCA